MPTDAMQQTHNLTPRERQIAAAIARGLPNREIARELGVSEQTVKNQLSILYEKLGVRGRVQLAMYVIRHRL